MSLFTVVIEGRLTASPQTGTTRDGREYVQFPIIHRTRYRNSSGALVDSKPMIFEIMCWGNLVGRVHNLSRNDEIVVEGGQLLPYIDQTGEAVLKIHARNVSVSMRNTEAHAGPRRPQRRGDMVTTPDRETYPVEAVSEVFTDLELVHHR